MSTVLVDLTDGIATLTLNRSEVRNAMNDEMINELNAALKSLGENNAVKVLIIKSAGDIFCAGADLNSMKAMLSYTTEENVQDALNLGEFFYQLYHFNKPTIAVVQGNAFGGGIAIMACCNIAIAAENADFCFSEVKMGLIPSLITPYIVNAIGVRLARTYFMSAMYFNARTALQMGLCHEVVAKEDLENHTHQWVSTILKNGPIAMHTIQTLLRPLEAIPISPLVVKLTAEKIAQIRVSPEAQEGLSAFLEKRTPAWIK